MFIFSMHTTYYQYFSCLKIWYCFYILSEHWNFSFCDKFTWGIIGMHFSEWNAHPFSSYLDVIDYFMSIAKVCRAIERYVVLFYRITVSSKLQSSHVYYFHLVTTFSVISFPIIIVWAKIYIIFFLQIKLQLKKII